MAPNPEINVRKLVTLPRKLVQKIEDFRFAHRMRSESEAIRMLISLGLHMDVQAQAGREYVEKLKAEATSKPPA